MDSEEGKFEAIRNIGNTRLVLVGGRRLRHGERKPQALATSNPSFTLPGPSICHRVALAIYVLTNC
jgi:hypothetical protein